MKIIDCHMHFSNIATMIEYAKTNSNVDYSPTGYNTECKEINIVKSICMGLSETQPFAFPDKTSKNPMPADLSDIIPEGIYVCTGINPHTLDDSALRELDRLLDSSKKTVGIKIYPGYYHVDINDSIYEPVYRLAEKHGVPVAFHSGDMFSEDGLLEYSHPLKIDRIAVKHKDLKIVICHMGNPWVMDACETAIRNKNVYLDISGLFIGDTDVIKRVTNKRLVMQMYLQGIEFLDGYEKLLFGTDWPLVPMAAYVDYCKNLIPESEWDNVFYNNALHVYDRLDDKK